MKAKDRKACFTRATKTLGRILADHKEAKARGDECGSMLDAMARRIAARAAIDPSLTRGETFEQLTSAPIDAD